MTTKASENRLLLFIYGNSYRDELGSHLIRYGSSNGQGNGKLYMRLLALLLITVNVVMVVTLSPALSLLVYLTNWIMLLTLLCVVLALLNNVTPSINEKKGRLALTHVVFETTAVINLLGIIAYWGFIHKVAMESG